MRKKTGTASAVPRDEKILRMIGLASKAGRLIIGAEKVVDAARSGIIFRRDGIIVVAADAAARTKRNIAFAAEEDAIKIVEVNVDMFELGRDGLEARIDFGRRGDRQNMSVSAIAGMPAEAKTKRPNKPQYINSNLSTSVTLRTLHILLKEMVNG